MKGRRWFALLAALLLAAPGGLAEAMPEAYAAVLESCYNVLYADWYRALTDEDVLGMGLCPMLLGFDDADRDRFGYLLEDLNGSGSPELILGLNNDAYVDTVYQLFTLDGGALSTVYTADEASALYLGDGGQLIYEEYGGAGELYCLVYALDGAGGANLADGVYSDDGGAYHTLDGAAVSEADFYDAVTRFEQGRRVPRYTPVRTWYGGTETAAAPAGSGYFSLRTLYDGAVPVLNALVPDGWSAGLTVDWSFVSTSSPGVAVARLQSPDGRAAIYLVSNQSYADMTVNGARVAEGVDRGLYMTNKFYRNAAEAQPLILERLGCGGAAFVEEYPVAESLRTLAEEGARVKLQSQLGAISEALGYEGTAADRLYRLGDTCIECLTLVTAAKSRSSTSRVQLDSLFWNVPFSIVLVADSRETCEAYRPLFELVVANSGFTSDFLFVNLRYGSAIDDAIHAGLMRQSYEYIMGDSGSWVQEYQSSPDYESRDFADEWSDVIKERYEYRTEDGSSIKVDTKYDAVYQDGDNFYLGTDGGAPDGWTKLDRIR